MAKTQKFFVGTRGNKSFYGSELFRKVLQTLRVFHLYAKREKIKERQCETTFLHIFGN